MDTQTGQEHLSDGNMETSDSTQVFPLPVNRNLQDSESDMTMLDTEDGGSLDMLLRQDTHENSDSDWSRVQRQKRSRISTGGRSGGEDDASYLDLDMNMDDFQKLSVDAKLSATFSKIGNIGEKVDKCLAIHSTVRRLESQMNEHSERITLLEYKTLDLEARSRRNNLIFGGIPESVNEDCFVTMANFLKSNLDLDPCPTISRVHRLGRYHRDRTRPIIALFINSRDTDLVLSKAKMLKGSNFSINRDYPREIANARKQLWPEYKNLRATYPNSKITMAYPAKIIKDGRVHVDMFPKWNLILQGDRVLSSVQEKLNVKQSQARDPRVVVGPSNVSKSHVHASSQSGARAQRSRSLQSSGHSRRSRQESRSPPADTSRGHAPWRRVQSTTQTSGQDPVADSEIRRPWVESPSASQSQSIFKTQH